MATLKNEIGNVYGYLTVIARVVNDSGGRAKWLCQCKCGNQVEVLGKSLRNGNTKSCGCYQRERAGQSNMNRVENIIGKKFGTALSGKASIFGGLILIFIGLEIFISGIIK